MMHNERFNFLSLGSTRRVKELVLTKEILSLIWTWLAPAGIQQ
jgi:hypothetical protein